MLLTPGSVLQCLLMFPVVLASRGSISRDFTIAKRAFVVAPDRRSEAHITDTEMFGEQHGEPFDDVSYAKNAHQRIQQILVAGCGKGEHLGSFQTVFVAVSPGYIGLPVNVAHGLGTKIKTPGSITLNADEYIQSVDITTYRQKTGFFHNIRRTRIGSITLTTNSKRSMTCGDKNSGDPSRHWEFKEQALLYFSGSQGDAIDALQAHFIPVENYWY